MVLVLGLAPVPTATEDRPTASSREAWFMAMSSRSWVVQGFTQPSLWIKDLQVLLERNVLMTSASTILGRKLHCFENLRM